MKNQKGNALFSLIIVCALLGLLSALAWAAGDALSEKSHNSIAAIEQTTLDTAQKSLVVKVKNNGDQKLRNLNLSCDVTMKSGSHVEGSTTLFVVLNPKATNIFTTKNLNYLKFKDPMIAAARVYEPLSLDEISALTCRIVQFEAM